jgi:ABC-type multidrug transport system ATPase subunit
VVLTTHYLQEAEELADRLAILHQGRILRTGTPAEVAASQPARISFGLPADAREPVPDLPGAVGTAGEEGRTGHGGCASPATCTTCSDATWR